MNKYKFDYVEQEDDYAMLYKGGHIGKISKKFPHKVVLLINNQPRNDPWTHTLVLTFSTPDEAKEYMNKHFLLFFKTFKFTNMERTPEEIIEDIKKNFPNCCVYDSIDGEEEKKIPDTKPVVTRSEPKKRDVKKDTNERTRIGKNYQRLGYAETDDHDAVIYSINDYLYARDGATAKKDKEPLEGPLVGYLRVNQVGNKFVQVKAKDHVKS